ncbi:inovirus-type Gp2 protein [Undibacterium sp. 14-3-2]|uniref:YagK/YfjJ domain-containing protein n=1 Tax=Undibacterium sp. 14-3-2 TaxID=2800129 RepID=UPI0019070234|nr:inovirus-type Gp2 protein [Undibacterium sp. 14-3-2]MBK1889293.1 inovirus-type Gp2 protein [Undibacterium sp. 14-3-2]
MNTLEKISVLEAFAEGKITSLGVNSNGVKFVSTDCYFLARELHQLEKIVIKISKSDQVLFGITADWKKQKYFLKPIGLGKNLLNELKINMDGINLHFPMHQMNPYIDLFLQELNKNTSMDPFEMERWATEEVINQRVSQLNEFVEKLRITTRSKEFCNLINNFQRSSNKNFQEGLKYIKALFTLHSRLLILRIDLGYAKSLDLLYEPDSTINHSLVRLHREKLLRYLKAQFPTVGFIWKLEYGLEKGFHYHLIVFLRGSRVQQDVNIAKKIGEQWNVITERKGVYYNCNASKSKYKYCGIGMINHHEEHLLHGLKKALLYITKVDYYVKCLLPDKGKTFGKGNMPQEPTSTVGRPRTKKGT